MKRLAKTRARLIRRNAIPHHYGERSALEARSGSKAKATENSPRFSAARQNLVTEIGCGAHRSENVNAQNGLSYLRAGMRRLEPGKAKAPKLRKYGWCELIGWS
jgi:hypothetical protein